MLFQKWSEEKDNAVATILMTFPIKLCGGFVISVAIKMVSLPLILPAVD
jgi:hypothetical protein